MKTASYQIDILDYVPYPTDSYTMTITNETTNEIVHTSTIEQGDPRRNVDSTRPNNSRMTIPTLIVPCTIPNFYSTE